MFLDMPSIRLLSVCSLTPLSSSSLSKVVRMQIIHR